VVPRGSGREKAEAVKKGSPTAESKAKGDLTQELRISIGGRKGGGGDPKRNYVNKMWFKGLPEKDGKERPV